MPLFDGKNETNMLSRLDSGKLTHYTPRPAQGITAVSPQAFIRLIRAPSAYQLHPNSNT